MRGIKIINEVKKSGIKPYKEGKLNFSHPKEAVEILAQERIEICKTCIYFEDEKVEFLKVEDRRIPDASNKFCDDCGCVIAYKIRQTLKPCEKWQK